MIVAEQNVVSSVALGLWCAQNVFSTLSAVAYAHGLPRPEIPGAEPRVAVILPVKGNPEFAGFLSRLRAQAYSSFRIIGAVESQQDLAYRILVSAASEPGPPIEVTVAGLSANAGQKVWNQLAALDRLRPEDEFVAFIDADTLPTPQWLPRLIAAAVNAGHPVVTGYRWMAPADRRVSSICLAAANASIATLPRGGLPLHLCWGGSMAMARSTLDTIGVRGYWANAISDDLQLTKALRRAGIPAYPPRQCLLLTPVSCSWSEFFAFGVRQYRLVFMHEPRTWLAALLCLWAPPVLFVSALPDLTAGSPGAWIVLAFIAAMGEARTRLRRRIQKALWPDTGQTLDEKRRWRMERLLRPFWWMAHAVCAACAPLSRTIDWAGVRYRVDGPQTVTVERREPR